MSNSDRLKSNLGSSFCSFSPTVLIFCLIRHLCAGEPISSANVAERDRDAFLSFVISAQTDSEFDKKCRRRRYMGILRRFVLNVSWRGKQFEYGIF